MKRVKLTAGEITRFACPEGKSQAFLRDSEVPKLAVRATPAGAKSFVFESKLAGKTIRTVIGDVDLWPISSKDPDRPGAREEARRLSALVDQGIDPRRAKLEELDANEARLQAEEAKQSEESRLQVRVADAWRDYLDARVASGKWGQRNLLDHQNIAILGGEPAKRGNRKKTPGVLAPLMTKRLAEITQEIMRSWMEKEIATRPSQTRLAFGHFRTFLSWCEGEVFVPAEFQPI